LWHRPQNVPYVSPTPLPLNPPSPSNSTSSGASGLSRAPSTPASTNQHIRRPSEYGPVERFKLNHLDHDGHRRNSMPSRLRTSSMSSTDFSGVEPWPISDRQPSLIDTGAAISSLGSTTEARKPRDFHGMDRVVTCLLAEDNPISIKILEVGVVPSFPSYLHPS
jgi:serine/threonine-protein kinase RIM15